MPPMEPPPARIAPWRASLSGDTPRQPPVLPNQGEHLSRKTFEEGFLFESHPDLFGDAARRQIIRVNKRNHARQFQIAKSVIPHGLRCFSRKSATPIIGIEPVPNFDFVRLVDLLMKETAIADQAIIVAMNDRKLRWKPATLPANEFVQKGNGLFPCKNTK